MEYYSVVKRNEPSDMQRHERNLNVHYCYRSQSTYCVTPTRALSGKGQNNGDNEKISGCQVGKWWG